MPFDADSDADSLRARFLRFAPAVDYCALRAVDEASDITTVRQCVVEPARRSFDRGAMLTVIDGDGIGYAATSDLSDAGLREAIARARHWAKLAQGRSVFASGAPQMPKPTGRFAAPSRRTLTMSRAERIEMLLQECRAATIDKRIVDTEASLWTIHTRQVLVTADGGEARQEFDYTIPSLGVTAHGAGITQTRSWGGRSNGFCQQGGQDVLERSGFVGSGRATGEEALQLLAAPNCPSGVLDTVLLPDQMMMQIHESIGHPLELDRILGDERNYAGTTFVTLDMFGSYQYGSGLLNVTYDPSRAEEFATFAFDDEGTAAHREYLIRDGILQRPLGGTTSLQRARQSTPGAGRLQGVATARACHWNRPPIDRMSNLNIEAGHSSLAQMVSSIELGVMMKTNRSWSIDDSRNKFQFGCEWGQMIRDGTLAEIVRDPNYRGVSSNFWRSLAMVGDDSTVEVMGTPYCGKGEPNQIVRVGHASPACKFTGVAVFGAER